MRSTYNPARVRARRPNRAARLPLGRSSALACATLLLLTGCPTAPVAPDAPRIAIQQVARSLTAPVAMAFPNDNSGRIFIVSQTGQIHILTSAGTLLDTPFLDLSDRMVELSDAYAERGLLGLAFHPDYAVNGRFYVYYTAPKGADVPVEFDSENHVSEFRVSQGDVNLADPGSERVLLRSPQPQANHFSGQLAFGPDGYLYIGTGDGGGGGDIDVGHTPGIGNAQDRNSLLGKILRIDVNSGDPYAIPADNPFVGVAGTRPEIFAYGFRNPWRFSFDVQSSGAARLFVGDVGQGLFEEVNIVTRGGNYGWRIREASSCFNIDSFAQPLASCAQTGANGEELIDPILEYSHMQGGNAFGTSVIGGFVYRGSAIPSLRGRYVFGDFSSGFLAGDGRIFAADEGDNGNWSFEELSVIGSPDERLGAYLYGFGMGPDGELYALVNNVPAPRGTGGALYKIIPAPQD